MQHRQTTIGNSKSQNRAAGFSLRDRGEAMNRLRVSALSKFRKLTLALVVIVAAAGGCQFPKRHSPYETSKQTNRERDTVTARRFNEEGLKAVEENKLEDAEEAFRKALEADLFYGPAHNNLGLVHMKKQDLYNAAWEFEYASKLMPHSAEPRNNLGLVMEKAGRLDDAIESYETALTIDTENPEIMGHLARAYIRKNVRHAKAQPLLNELAIKHPDHQWGRWAISRITTLENDN